MYTESVHIGVDAWARLLDDVVAYVVRIRSEAKATGGGSQATVSVAGRPLPTA